MIRSMIIQGEMADGERLNEVHLSDRLGVSRTPVRESLNQLVVDGFIELIPRRGFFVRELSGEEFSDLFDLRPLLDPQALLISGTPNETDLSVIEKANQVFQNALTNEEAVTADEAFHRYLIQHCPNRVLLDLIDNIMARTKRYELALFRNTSAQYLAGNTHIKIIDALRAQDLQSACGHLRDNLCEGKADIIDWLNSRKTS